MDFSKPLFRLTLPLLSLLVLLLLASRPPAGAISPLSAQATTAYVQSFIEASDVDSGDGFGTSVARSGDLLAVGATGADINGVSGGAVYLFERDEQSPIGWREIHKLHRDPPHQGGYFGYRVALQGDTLLVGTPADPRDGSADWQGAAYIYERNHGGPDAWGLVAQLADEATGPFRRFGHALAIDGDLIAVSAVGADSNRGKVYLYSRSAGWARTKALSDPTGQPFDWFGSSLALEGDRLVVGAQAADLDAANIGTGAAFVYERNQGGADQWGLVTRLVADPPEFDSFFGSRVALEDDTLVVAAYNADRYEGGQPVAHQVGAAYVFEKDQGGVNGWGQVAILQPSDGAVLDRFGSGLALAGNDLWLGAPNRAVPGGFGGEGTVYHYRRDEGSPGAWGLVSPVAADPGSRNADFGSALAAEGGVLLAGAPEHETQGAVYLIEVADDFGTAGPGVFIPLLMNEWVPPTGTLVDGGSLESPSGAIVGAVPGTLTEPLLATIVETRAPAEPMPGGFLPRGAHYRLAADRLTIAPADKPLLVGLPVPAGADTGRLAVAVYLPGGLQSESDEPAVPARSWTSVPGSYDAANNLFVTTLRALLPEGVTLVLFEHPENVPLPPAGDAARNVHAPTAVEFNVTCDPAAENKDVCVNAYYVLVASELADAYHEFVELHFFQPPAMVHLAGSFTGPDKDPTLNETYYGALIATQPCINDTGQPIFGQYSYLTLQVLICIDEMGSSDSLRYTVRHELFHAIQASYPALANDRIRDGSRPLSHWLIEGTASAAERSSYLMLRSPDWLLRQVNEPLTSTVRTVEYDVQDFWVYTGLEGPQSDHYISYLRPIFEQGATPQHVAQAMNLGEAYWQWAKNQFIEHHQPMIDAFDSGPCELEAAAYNPDLTNVLNYPSQVFVEGELSPLTSAVVEIRVAQAVGNLHVFADNNADRADLRYKVYEDGVSGCKDVPDGERFLQNVPAGGKRYVLVSNVSLTDTFTYAVEVD
jgi:DNA polymerase IIIc chi subunit